MSRLPRWLEAWLALLGLLATLPLLAVAALAVRLTSPGPAFFRQTRVGRDGRSFVLLKLRSMRVESRPGSAVTVRGDARITPVGRLLRCTKLDELPQLWNVLRGDLALVGPRPEVPAYCDASDPLWRRVLTVRPGITDPVTLRLRGEESLLAGLQAATGDDAEAIYRRHLQPWKLRGYVAYLEVRSAWSDVRCLLATVLSPLGLSFGFRLDAPTVDEVLEVSVAAPASKASGNELPEGTRPDSPSRWRRRWRPSVGWFRYAPITDRTNRESSMPTKTKTAEPSEKRSEYVEKMKEQLDELNAWIVRAEKQLEEKTAPSRAKLEEQIESAKGNYQKGLAKLQEIREGGEEQFQRLRGEAEHVWKAFRHSVNYFKSQL